MEYIDGSKGWKTELFSKDDIVSSIMEFNLSYKKSSMISNLRLISFIRNPVFSMLKGLAKNIKRINLKFFLKSILFIIIYEFKLTGCKSFFLMHGDVSRYQNIISSLNGLYYIDFESSIITKKFYLLDIVGLAIDYEKIRLNNQYWLDIDLINNYLKAHPCKDSLKIIKNQIRLLIFYKICNTTESLLFNRLVFLINDPYYFNNILTKNLKV
jgi:hypothetical protein